jgi:outer membrane lipoprotein-sorting protein
MPNMKKIISLALALFTGVGMGIHAQDLDEILDNYFEVIGLSKVLETETVISKGKAVQMGMEFPMTLYQKRPGKARMEAEIQGTVFIQAYNGESGWTVMPWTGTAEPQDLSEDQVKAMEQMSDIEGDLYNWEEKGHKLSLIGEEDMEGTPIYKLKLEKEDGDLYYYYLDAENFVILKVDAQVMVQGTAVESSSYYTNFKPVEGMIMPFSIETRINDQVTMNIMLEEILVNEEVDDNIFEKTDPTE